MTQDTQSDTDRGESADSGRTSSFMFRLYITGATPRSRKAIENFKELCERYLPEQCDVQIIDMYQQPELIKKAQIVVSPTLVKELPLPLQKFIGDLSNVEDIALELGLKETSPM